MKKYVLGFALVVALSGCEPKENTALQQKVDSLSLELTARKEVERSMNEVGVLIDSIDSSRKLLQVNMLEGDNYADYVSRLNEINTYVKETEVKLDRLEDSNRNTSKASASSIRRLKADLEKRSVEIIELQFQIAKLRDENLAAWRKVNEKDSVLSMKDQQIKLSQYDIDSLEKLFNDTQAENKTTVADLYFAQAEALVETANRTQFAPRSKKETRLEALELYRLSLSLGNTKAQARIDELERKLS